jgi:hypothetical protein
VDVNCINQADFAAYSGNAADDSNLDVYRQAAPKT